MAENNTLIGLSLNILWIGLFLMSMVTGYVLLVNSEGQGDMFDGYEEFTGFNRNLTSQLTGDIKNVANTNNNLSATYNPELAISAADQSGNAIGINMQDLTVDVWNSISKFGGLIFGNIWTATLSIILSSILIMLFSYYLLRWIRSGN